MAFREQFDFDTQGEKIVITGIDDFDYQEQDFSYWREDCYGNVYHSNDSYFEVEPEISETGSFPELMKNHLAYLVNLSALEASEVNIPDFEAGVVIEDEARPYTVIEKSEGRPLSHCTEVLDQDDWSQKFQEMNEEGRRLSSSRKIIYPEERSNTDVIVDTEDERLLYINPGTFTENAFYCQFSRSNAVPSNRTELGKWLSEEFWTRQVE